MRDYEHFSFDRSQVSPTVPEKLGSIFCGVWYEISVLSSNEKTKIIENLLVWLTCAVRFLILVNVYLKINKILSVYPKNKYISFMNTFKGKVQNC